MSASSFQVSMFKLKKNKVIVNNKIDRRLIPKITGNNYILALYWLYISISRMDNEKINQIIAQKTAEQLGIKTSLVKKVIEQYCSSIKKLSDGIDFISLTPETYKQLYRRAFYIPGLGKFVMNWKLIEACQIYERRKHENKNKGRNSNDVTDICDK